MTTARRVGSNYIELQNNSLNFGHGVGGVEALLHSLCCCVYMRHHARFNTSQLENLEPATRDAAAFLLTSKVELSHLDYGALNRLYITIFYSISAISAA